jgi:PhoPQ-activated pathogenicity-related protein
MTEATIPFSKDQTAIDNFFTEVIGTLTADHMMLAQDIASPETKNFYNKMMSDNPLIYVGETRDMSTKAFVRHILTDFVNAVKNRKHLPLKLAIGLSDSKILVWSEIEDDDETTEDALLMAEAEVNAKYHDYGFYLNSTIVEQSDNLPIPPHYHNLIG